VIDLGTWRLACYKSGFKIITGTQGEDSMGKGDRRTKRGKIWRSSTGNSRPKKQNKAKAKK
jgi:30S ribosomal protein S31